MMIALHVTPKSSRNEIVGVIEAEGGKKALKVKVAAPPEDGKANAELIKFLAKQWDVPKSALELVSGESSRHKRLKIHSGALASRLAGLGL